MRARLAVWKGDVMGRTRRAIVAGIVCGSLGGVAVADAPDPIFGYWLIESKAAIIKIGPCPSGACGEIAWMREPRDSAGALKLDRGNPDAALRGRPLCGLPLITGLRRTGPGTWQSGSIYDPRGGSVYSASAIVRDGDALELRGYLGLPLLGQSRTWTRTTDARGGC